MFPLSSHCVSAFKNQDPLLVLPVNDEKKKHYFWILGDLLILGQQTLSNIQSFEGFSMSWDIKATPTFYFFRNGEAVDKLAGANKPELLKKAATIVESNAKQS
ncbi:hypothetical protein Ancab_006124 [Ancistrocladus abbreviatus]